MSEAAYLPRRMKYLRNAEGAFAVALPLAFAAFWMGGDSSPQWGVRLPPLALVSYILAQGSLYWGIKFRQYAYQAPLPQWLRAAFRLLFLSNLIGLAAVAVVVLLAGPRGVARVDIAWAAGLWLFAALEHINYYHFQLMYDTRGALRRLRVTKRLRTPMLASDIRGM